MMRPEKKSPIRVPLRVLLVSSYVVLVVLTGALSGYLSFRNGQQAVNEVAHQLRDELTTNIEEHLLSFLGVPHDINQNNASLIGQGLLDSTDAGALEHHFWEQVRTHDSVTSIYFGNTNGGLVDAGREGADGTPYVIVTDRFANGTFRKYATDSEGNRTGLMQVVADFDARTRPWYAGAMEKGDSFWSDIYILYTGQDMAIAASRPVYDEDNNLLGVVSVDLFLSHLNSFLQNLRLGETGQAFIMERSGLLVASSTADRLFSEAGGEEPQRRLHAGESATPLIRYAAEALSKQSGDYQTIVGSQHLEFEIDGERHFVQVRPVQNQYGLDWLVVVVIPEADFMGQINASARTTAFLIAAILAAAAVVGIIATYLISRPMMQLNESAQALAQGDWTQPVGDGGWIGEVREVTQSFHQMAGQLQQMMGSLTSEITERRQAEEALRESEERLELALGGAELGVWDWNVATGSVVFSERWAEMLGYDLSDVEPRYSTWEQLLHPDVTDDVLTVLHEHLEGRIPIYRTEQRLRTKSGQWKWILATGKVVERDEEGNPLRAVGMHQDITERKSAETALHESNRRLEETLTQLRETQDRVVRQERMAAIGQLSAGFAHYFNNILTGTLGFAELIRMTPDIPESTLADVEGIIASTHRAAHLINQILDYSRKSTRQLQQIDVGITIENLVAALEDIVPKTIHIKLEVEPGELVMAADQSQMKQMLTNLVLNAKDTMPTGGDVRIGVSRVEALGDADCAGCGAAIVGDWIRITVTDNGAGIPSELVTRVFEPFFTTQEFGQGPGLGLSQVLGIVEQHAGHIAVQSQMSRGTTFAIYLPPLPSDSSPSESS